MADDKLPYYKRYPRDYLSDENVALMTLEEEGAYNRLMDYCWLHGSIPADLGRMARLCQIGEGKMQDLWPALEPCFDAEGNRYTHPRLEKERTDAKSRSAAARKAAHVRWSNRKSKSDKGDNANAERTQSGPRAGPQSEKMPYTEAEAETDTNTPPKSPPRQNGGGGKEKSTAETDWSVVMRKLRNRNESCLSELTDDGSYALEQIGGLDTLTGASKKDVRHIRRDFMSVHPDD